MGVPSLGLASPEHCPCPGQALPIPLPSCQTQDALGAFRETLVSLVYEQVGGRPWPLMTPMPPAPTGSAPEDPQAQKLLTQMTQLDGDLKQIERQVLAWARTPLSRTTPLEDLEGRIQSHKVGR